MHRSVVPVVRGKWEPMVSWNKLTKPRAALESQGIDLLPVPRTGVAQDGPRTKLWMSLEGGS